MVDVQSIPVLGKELNSYSQSIDGWISKAKTFNDVEETMKLPQPPGKHTEVNLMGSQTYLKSTTFYSAHVAVLIKLHNAKPQHIK